MRPFLAELRRRNVYKVAVAYAVVAWIALQAASFLLPTFGAPAWVFQARDVSHRPRVTDASTRV